MFLWLRLLCVSRNRLHVSSEMELLHLHLFGTAPGGAGVGAAPEAVPNGAYINHLKNKIHDLECRVKSLEDEAEANALVVSIER